MNTAVSQLEADLKQQVPRAARGQARRATVAWLFRADQEPVAVQVAADLDGSLIAAMPADAEFDPAAPVLLAFTDNKAQASGYRSLHTVALKTASLPRQRLRLQNRHPELAEDIGQGNLSIVHCEPLQVQLMALDGERRDLEPREYLLEIGDAPELTENEQANLEHQNADHADISHQLCTQILEQADGHWLVTGLDPEGMDFRCSEQRCRLPFPVAAYDRQSLGDAIKAYVKTARARLGINSKAD
jgi:hypothetical protein